LSRRAATIALAVLLVGIIVLVWQWRNLSYHGVIGPAERWSSEVTYCFCDRSDPTWEYLYAVRGNEVMVQKAVFPGYTDRTWYRHTVQSDDLMNRIKEWAVRNGNTSPPFPPGGVWWCRISIAPDETKQRGEAWFENQTPEVSDWFGTLKREFVKEEQRAETLPNWVSGVPRVKKYFGYRE
jgi:hypothetical protein